MNSKITKEIDLAVKDKLSPVLNTLSKAVYALTQAIAKFHQEQDRAFDATLKNIRLEIKGHEDANKALRKKIELKKQESEEEDRRKKSADKYKQDASKIGSRMKSLADIKSQISISGLQKRADSKFGKALELYESGSKEFGDSQMAAAFGSYSKVSAALGAFGIALEVTKTVVKTVNEGFKLLGIDLGSFIDGVKENIKSLTSMKSGMATYSFGSSLISNSAARNQALEYGLDSASNFAFTKAQEMYGISSREDLFYMNVDQRNAFMESMSTFKKYYANLEKSGALNSLQELQLELEQMKMEISMEFLTWFSENKMVILGLMRISVDVLKSLMGVVTRIANFLSPEIQYAGSDVKLTGKSSGKTLNVTNTITVNGTANATEIAGRVTNSLQQAAQGF